MNNPSTNAPAQMQAVQVAQFGGVEALEYVTLATPTPSSGQVLVRVRAAGVGPWDAWIRSGNSALPQPLPLTPGSDIAGTVVALGEDVKDFWPGDDVFGVTNARFTGGYAEYALADATMLARKPAGLSFTQAAAVPVVASTALQMAFEHSDVGPGKRVLVLGGAGLVGSSAVQLALDAGASVIATGHPHQLDAIRRLGSVDVIDGSGPSLSLHVAQVDIVLDTVGGDSLAQAYELVRPGGTLVTAVTEPDQDQAHTYGIRALFFLVAVRQRELDRIADLIGDGKLSIPVGETLPLSQARIAHDMVEGRRARKPGKIVLIPD